MFESERPVVPAHPLLAALAQDLSRVGFKATERNEAHICYDFSHYDVSFQPPKYTVWQFCGTLLWEDGCVIILEPFARRDDAHRFNAGDPLLAARIMTTFGLSKAKVIEQCYGDRRVKSRQDYPQSANQ